MNNKDNSVYVCSQTFEIFPASCLNPKFSNKMPHFKLARPYKSGSVIVLGFSLFSSAIILLMWTGVPFINILFVAMNLIWVEMCLAGQV